MTAFELNALVGRHRRTAERVARKFAPKLPPGATADDLEAAALHRMWLALRRTGGGRTLAGDLEPYLFVAACNGARSFIREARRRGVRGVPAAARARFRVVNEPAADDDGPALAELVPVEAAGDDRPAWPAARWAAVLACVPGYLKAVVVRRVFHDDTFDRIAAATGVSPAEARRRFDQAAAAIRLAHPELAGELVTR